jgi:hypothetical protein
MTPIEHYTAAERILSDLTDEPHTLSDADEAYLLGVAHVHALLALFQERQVILGPGPAPIKPLPGSNGDVDRRPHSRACGIRYHLHGYACSTNCPTCHGVPTPGANQ